MTKPVRILHAHSTFSAGGKEMRSVRLMNAFGAAAEHDVISAMPERLEARSAIDLDLFRIRRREWSFGFEPSVIGVFRTADFNVPNECCCR